MKSGDNLSAERRSNLDLMLSADSACEN